MVFEPLVRLLSDGGHGLFGESLFIYQYPTDKDGILLRDSPSGTDIDPYMTGYRQGLFELICRGDNLIEAREKLKRAMQAISVNGRVVSNLGETIEIKVCRPIHEPVMFKASVAGKYEWTVSFSIHYATIK